MRPLIRSKHDPLWNHCKVARDPENILQEAEVLKAVRSLKNHKAVGADGIPVEIYKVSTSAFKLLFELLRRVWQEESVPEDLGRSGSVQDDI